VPDLERPLKNGRNGHLREVGVGVADEGEGRHLRDHTTPEAFLGGGHRTFDC